MLQCPVLWVPRRVPRCPQLLSTDLNKKGCTDEQYEYIGYVAGGRETHVEKVDASNMLGVILSETSDQTRSYSSVWTNA